MPEAYGRARSGVEAEPRWDFARYRSLPDVMDLLGSQNLSSMAPGSELRSDALFTGGLRPGPACMPARDRYNKCP
eukprot:scaffold392_cov101-Isochrysis_galbana.AAC.11